MSLTLLGPAGMARAVEVEEVEGLCLATFVRGCPSGGGGGSAAAAAATVAWTAFSATESATAGVGAGAVG